MATGLPKGKWSNSAITPLVLPKVHLREVVDFKAQRKPKGLSGIEIVEGGHFVCEIRFQGVSCTNLVRSLNSFAPAALKPESEGPAILPFHRLTASIPTHRAADQQKKSSTHRHSEAWAKALAKSNSRVWVATELG